MKGMKKSVVVFLFLFLFVGNTYSQSGWVQLNTGVSTGVYSLFFNNGIGYAGGLNFIIKTSNEGTNWNIISNNSASNIQFINTNTGFALGGSGVLKSINAGANWLSYSIPFFVECLFIVDSLVGYGSGSNGTRFMKTFNGGQTWFPIDIGAEYYNFHSTYFVNQDTGYIAGGVDFKPSPTLYIIRKTTNGGANWSTLISGQSRHLRLIYFSSINSGYAVGGSYIFRTTDAGASWSETSTQNSNFYYSINFPNPDTGFVAGSYEGAGGGGRIWKTTNAGLNWFSLFNYQYRFRSIQFINGLTGFVCCDYNGIILKSTNGGITFLNPISNEIPNNFSLSQNYPNPFNPNTKIKFQIAAVGQTFLSVHNALGQVVVALVNEQLQPGTYEVDWDASNYPSGVYFYKLQTEHFTETKKIVLLK